MKYSLESGWRVSPPRWSAATYLPKGAGTSKEVSAPGIALKKTLDLIEGARSVPSKSASLFVELTYFVSFQKH